MANVDEDPSILLFGINGKDMATPEIALTMAELLTKRAYGEAELKAQLPLRVTDGVDRWIVEGSRKGEADDVRPGELHRDRVVVHIRKSNCQVLKLIRMTW